MPENIEHEKQSNDPYKDQFALLRQAADYFGVELETDWMIAPEDVEAYEQSLAKTQADLPGAPLVVQSLLAQQSLKNYPPGHGMLPHDAEMLTFGKGIFDRYYGADELPAWQVLEFDDQEAMEDAFGEGVSTEDMQAEITSEINTYLNLVLKDDSTGLREAFTEVFEGDAQQLLRTTDPSDALSRPPIVVPSSLNIIEFKDGIYQDQFERIRKSYWDGLPMPKWKEKVDEALGVLSRGEPVSTLQGLYGIGKTQQFSRLLSKEVIEGGKTCSGVELISLRQNLVDDVLIVDEAIGVLRSDKELEMLSEVVAERRTKEQQTVIIIPGPNKGERGIALDIITDKLDAPIHDLGDMDKMYIDEEQASVIMRAAGKGEDFIKFVKTVPLLLTPRVFDTMVLGYNLDYTERLEDLQNRLIDWINGDSRVQINRTSAGDLQLNPFQGNNGTYTECMGLYEAMGVPLPDMSEMRLEFGQLQPHEKS